MSDLVPYTTEYLQHHAVRRPDKKVAAYSRLTRLDMLRDDGRIDQDQWTAGDSYRTDLERSERGSIAGGSDGMPSGHSLLSQSDHVMLSRRRIAEVDRTLLPVYRLAALALAYDVSFANLARRLNGESVTAMLWSDELHLPPSRRGVTERRAKLIAAEALDKLVPIYVRAPAPARSGA